MDNVDKVDSIIREFLPHKIIPSWLRKLIKWAFGEKIITTAFPDFSEKQGVEWVKAAAEKISFHCKIDDDDYNNIPRFGPVVIIANHPTVMDGVAIINIVANVRKDVKIVANHVLSLIFPPTKPISVSIRNMQGKMSHKKFREMNDHLKQGGVLVILPAGRLAGMTLRGLRESPWHAGFIQLAIKNNAAIVPIYLNGRNSIRYYLTVLISRPLSNLMVIREVLRHRGKTLGMKIFHQIDLSAMNRKNIDFSKTAFDIQQHLFRVGNNLPGLVPTRPPVSAPVSRCELINGLARCELMKTCSDGKGLYLYRYQDEVDCPLLHELGRLREISFRAIGAGTGKLCDNDIYDQEYHHIIFWDPQQLEIVGSYRLIPAGIPLAKRGLAGLYSHSLFNYQRSEFPQIEKTIEIGRGFIQSGYQKTSALDELWKGIFIYTQRYPEYKYLLGVLSIPGSFSALAKNLIVQFYNLYFSFDRKFCYPENEYTINDESVEFFFLGDDIDSDWKRLNEKLTGLDCTLPWPYKQAAKWYCSGGSKLCCFIEDHSLKTLAGLNLCKIEKLKEIYRRHYFNKK
ncbi:lysophospholipid acyltransferase family protein [Erwinia tasmaniensis]|uniref:lysophospholipid acyltransferase family protein n=1 Tax=Erwinia tasmaniensis TaxID=338565 RepID=UPI003A4DFDA9